MNLSNIYNFRNTIRHFINIDQLIYPQDIQTFDPIKELCWTKPIPFRIYKANDKYRIIKIPNVLNFVSAYYYYKNLPNFENVMSLDSIHKRLAANLETGDFVSGNFDQQLSEDFFRLCNYDYLLKLDISEYYGRIYTHYLDLGDLKDNPLAWLNYGRTGGILMGNYLSLYFAEALSSRISKSLQEYIESEEIECVFNYFSDDFYFFCNESDLEKVQRLFDKVLAEYDFERKKTKELWTYESYNEYNLLTRYWKATIRTWNLDVLKDYQVQEKHESTVKHKYSFLNQLVYRLSGLKDEKSKRSFITNFFKTKHFQNTAFSDYELRTYDLHQLFFLIKSSPESLLYISHILSNISEIKNDPKTKSFIKARYKESLNQELHDVQMYYFYAISVLNFDDVLRELSGLVLNSQNQVLVSYYLKNQLFTQVEIDSLKVNDQEDYWFRNYHLILYTPSLSSDLENSIKKYLIPQMLRENHKPEKDQRYIDFYKDNLQNGNSLICEISDVTDSIKNYLNLRYEETAVEFEENDSDENELNANEIEEIPFA